MVKFNVGKYGEFGILAISGIIFLVALNLLFFLLLGDVNIDLTKDKKYSLSDASINFLKENDEQINIRFFVSKDLKSKNPKLAEYAEYLRKLFVEYKNKGLGNIELSMVDVVPFENSQFEAEKYGIKEFDHNEGNYQYLGASFSNRYGQFQSISQFYPERKNMVEDDITRMLSVIVKKRKPYLGIISSIFSVADENNPTKQMTNWPFVKNMEKFGYNVLSIRSTTPSIDENIDVVLLLYPMDVSTSLIYALDQYLVKGGSVVIMMDVFSEERFREQSEYFGYKSGLFNFLKKHGIYYNEQLVVGDSANSRILVMDGKKIQYPFKINITGQMMSDHPINNNIDVIYYNHGGYFEYEQQDDMFETIIAKTSDNGGVMPAINLTDLGYDDLVKNYAYTKENYILSLLVEGKFAPYYSFPPIKDAELIAKLPVFIATPQKEGKLLLLGDADIVNEVLWNANIEDRNGIYDITYSSDNLLFLRNIFDYMSGSNYSEVIKKNSTKLNENLTDVFRKKAVGFYEDVKNEKYADLMKVKEELMKIDAKKSDLDIFMAKNIKEKEQLIRKEAEINQELRKIVYLTGEKYSLYMILFSVFAIALVPLSVTLIVWMIYKSYNRMLIKKAKEYIHE